MQRLLATSVVVTIALSLLGGPTQAPIATQVSPTAEQPTLWGTLADYFLLLNPRNESNLFTSATPKGRTQPGQHESELSLEVPMLQGASPYLSTRFNESINRLAAERYDEFNRLNTEMCADRRDVPYPSEFSIAPLHTEAYDGRYVSASLNVGSSYCGGVWNSEKVGLTMDIFSGEEVSADTFTDLDSGLTKLAVLRNADAELSNCIGAEDIGKLPTMPEPTSWQAGRDGLYLFFEKYALGAGACGSPEVLIPWGQVATDEELKGQVHEQIFVTGFSPKSSGQSIATGTIAGVAVRGRHVAVGLFGVPGDGDCSHGVRDGDHAVVNSTFSGFGEKFAQTVEFDSAAPEAAVKLNSLADTGAGWKPLGKKQRQQLEQSVGRSLSIEKLCMDRLDNFVQD